MDEILQFLDDNSLANVRQQALKHVLDLTGTEDGRQLLASNEDIILRMLRLSEKQEKDACLALVNLSADEALVPLLIQKGAVSIVVQGSIDLQSSVVDPMSMAACNLTRDQAGAEKAWQELGDAGLEHILTALLQPMEKAEERELHHFAQLLANLSQLSQVRAILLNPSRCFLPRLISLVQFEASSVRRGGVIGALRNCCFETEHHAWLLGPEVDLLPALLLPLAGSEEYKDDENERLPPDLQYLGVDKQREPDAQLRCLLLEALTRLCATRATREAIREQGAVYLILRELHKWEEDRAALLACENLVDLLIRTEDEIGVDDLRSVNIPDNLQEDFKKADEAYLNS